MVNELDMLQRRVDEVAALCSALRADNFALRRSLVAANEEKSSLTERINSARKRLEVLARQLPESKEGDVFIHD
jgi:cell division protein ZapB